MANQGPITWERYKSWVSQLAKDHAYYYCRGHANEHWKLQTSFHRLASPAGITLEDYRTTIIPELHYHICAQANEIINLQCPEEFGAFLALLQHHGFPTPLLDWTLSPYIAAYFAFREVNDTSPESDNVRIFVFDYVNWSRHFSQPLDLSEMKIKYVSVFRPYAKYNPRLIPQQGVFTVTNVDDMEEYILRRSTDVNKKFLFKALLSVKEKPHIMRELNLMGINEMSLFPSVDGICRAMRARFFSQKTVGLTPSEWIDFIRTQSTPKTENKKIEG
ncbi:MAG: FRG domain-containing protein [Planctomycetes bacterium]|uniref:FRG domain-containing protein n=1 Tax=Candidatus Wunengus sp. YC65 TaxID=3367701 RepID=UPI001D3BA88E|nr:FRG domain-containing protein [Planctomycetota bacterium]